MTAEQVIDAIHAARYTGDKNGLSNTKQLFQKLAMPFDAVPAIHVAGTNGKGSTCAMIESTLRCAGYKTGLYTSPFLQRFNERIAINGVPITDEQLAHYGKRVLEAAKGTQATAFEIGTALAWLVFMSEKVDYAVIEVGLGGRLDPTNVINPKISVITSIGLDHMAILGNTVEEIAAEKAGIMKPNVPVVIAPCTDTVFAIFQSMAKGPITRLFSDEVQVIHSARENSCVVVDNLRIYLPLAGAHQAVNALNAVAVLRQIGIGDGDIQKGIANTFWPARLEWHQNILIDGAHNAQGAQALKAYVETYLANEKRVLLTGVIEDKLTDEMIAALGQIADTIVTVAPNNVKAVSADKLKVQFEGAVAEKSIVDGLASAQRLAGKNGIVIVAGSLYLAGEVRSILGLKPR